MSLLDHAKALQTCVLVVLLLLVSMHNAVAHESASTVTSYRSTSCLGAPGYD